MVANPYDDLPNVFLTPIFASCSKFERYVALSDSSDYLFKAFQNVQTV
jgi:hypothetical protein